MVSLGISAWCRNEGRTTDEKGFDNGKESGSDIVSGMEAFMTLITNLVTRVIDAGVTMEDIYRLTTSAG